MTTKDLTKSKNLRKHIMQGVKYRMIEIADIDKNTEYEENIYGGSDINTAQTSTKNLKQ